MAKKTINGIVYDVGEAAASVYGHTEDIPETVILLNSVDGRKVVQISSMAFRKCKTLMSITIPDGVKYIMGDAFFDCASLKDLTIPDSVVGIDRRAFANCKSLTNIRIPNSVHHIGDKAFTGCASLENITISSDNVDYVGAEAFFVRDSLNVPTVTFTGTSGAFLKMFAPSFCVRWDGFSIPLTVKCSDETIRI